MNRAFSIAILLVCSAFSVASQAQAPAAQAPLTGVVTVSFNAAVLETAEAQRELAALRTKYAPRQAELKTLNDEIEGLRKQLEASGDKLTELEQANRGQELDLKEKKLQRDSEDLKSDSQADSQQVLQAVAQKLYAFLQTYAQQHGYALVVERGSSAAPVVWYAAGNLDITEQLTKAYNAQSAAAAPASTAKPAAPAAQKP